ncbi:MAG TPA: elongation factor P lysine(34) lysyltransferase [Halomonas campaniensis]|uniref:Elongation factor P lysine(34) lysyltransferase n=1 Tax=Halomonas campaniensis TaxID=213554 RepID=A0A3D0KEW5_9GAMM|nr:EF-P lysine aminoacylase EpmA [Halomonas sp. 3F2F]HCA01709.1 elongation factor P lysine(34) lysyltransferase [Halomonas campaniensis]
MTASWQPTASIETLRERARLLAGVRAFFAERDVLEVETPVLGQGGSTDVHLVSLASMARTDKGQRRLWLQTSPEFHMKRLLAAGSGPIFQLAKSFRDGEIGSRHNIEFTMLEWYRPGFTLAQLIDETTTLVANVLPSFAGPVVHYRYRELFHTYLAVDPFTTSIETLRTLAAERGQMPTHALAEESRDTCLDLLMSMVIEPTLGQNELSVVVDYPASQAALARRHQDADGEWVASRFELYLNGVELANGYDELIDAEEQRLRFSEDNAERRRLGLPEVDVDEQLLAALDHGMPESAGVALGMDRLIQLALGKARLEDVLTFSTANC